MNILITFVAQDLIYITSIFVIFYILLKNKNKKFIVDILYVSLSTSIAWCMANILKNIFKTTRPEQAQYILSKSESIYAFPSGHTAYLFAMATALYFYNKKLAYIIYVIGIAVGTARVYIGVHYPIDILGGIAVGISVGLLTNFIYKKIRN